jgi:general secretion pathway protein N
MARRRTPDWTPPRRTARRFALAGAGVGLLAALVAFAPAAWLASAVADATDDRLLLADARGSVWSGSAVPVLTAGAGSRDASTLPGRLSWSIGLDGLALGLRARQDCCINGELRLRIQPGIGRTTVTLLPSAGAIGQWPAAWLSGLGTPFNTLRLAGSVSLASGGLVAEGAAGRWQLKGDATLSFIGVSSRLSTIERLGSYRLVLSGGDVARIALTTQDGPLLLSGSGEWAASGLRFRGEARAAPGSETALNNLLNLIGRRQGTLSVLSIG